MKNFSSLLTMPKSALVLFIVALGALGFVLMMQYVFGYEPCILCIYQRVPLGIVLGLSLLALLWRPFGRHTRVILGLCALAFFINAATATFHTGVERHWWLGTAGCSITPLHGYSTEDLREKLLHTITGHCDEISWSFLGLTMANYNIPFSLLMGCFATAAALPHRKN